MPALKNPRHEAFAQGSQSKCRRPSSDMDMMAGKASDPIPMPFTKILCAVTGQRLAEKWVADHPIYRTWRVAGVECSHEPLNDAKRA